MRITAFRSERFVIAVDAGRRRHKLFQLLFRKTDGSVFVSFPYYLDEPGILSLATLRARTSGPTDISLIDGGKVTGHKVKFSYHPDGRVHFSQDGKIRTEIVKNSIPLADADGHIFTVQLQGIEDFASLAANELPPVNGPKKTILNFRFEKGEPESIKFVAHCYSKLALVPRISNNAEKPWLGMVKPDGSVTIGVVIENPFLSASQTHYLLLTCEAIPRLDKGRKSTLAFIGGFDRKEVALNHESDTSFLALAYPATDSYADLLSRIGSVDHSCEDIKSGKSRYFSGSPHTT